VCSPSHGGGMRTGIRSPLYITGGATTEIGPEDTNQHQLAWETKGGT
jgi:hypothetical protein